MSAALSRLRSALLEPRSFWPWLIASTLAVVPHLRVLGNPFAFDDWAIIVENPYMRDPHALRNIFSAGAWQFLGKVGASNFYRPVFHLYNYAVYRMAGPHPGWYHAFGLLLHAAVTLLVIQLVRKAGARFEVAWLAGVLFAVHPVHAEVVAWIACSPELLASAFSLLALILYLDAEGRRGGRRALMLAAMGITLLAGELSKEIALMVAPAVVAYEWLVKRRGVVTQLRLKWREYAVVAGVTLAYLAARVHVLGSLLPVAGPSSVSARERVWTAVSLVYRYTRLLLYPLHLSFFRHERLVEGWTDSWALASLLFIGAFAALTVVLYRRRAPESFAVVLYFLPLLPVFAMPYVVTGLVVIDRFAYLPSVGLCWLLAAGAWKLSERANARVVLVLLLIVVGAWAGRSALRVADWSDEVELARHGTIEAPQTFSTWAFYGDVLMRHNRAAEAIAPLERAVQIRDNYADAWNSLGRAYMLLNRPADAVINYRRAADLSLAQNEPFSAARAFSNLGIAYRAANADDEAIGAYRKALSLDPSFSAVRNNLGYALLVRGDLPEAVRQLEMTVAQDPALVPAHANLGLAYAMSGRLAEAEAELGIAARMSPDGAEILARLGEVALMRGDIAQARARLVRALELQPDNPRALHAMSAVEARWKR